MQLLQSRRSALRVEIRRNQVDALMRAKRQQLTFDEQHRRILGMIAEGLRSHPASIFGHLEEYFRGCSAVEGKAFASAVWKYLVSSCFRKSSISCQGLPQLLACIIQLLSPQERRQLPCKLLPSIFQYFWEASNSGGCGDGQLLDAAILISLDASKQSQCQFSLRQQEIQSAICRAHQELSIGSIQLLLLTLANLEPEAVGRHWKAMLREIARRAVGWLDEERRKTALQLLLLVGRLNALDQRDAGLARFLLQTYQETSFTLALRFLAAQSEQTLLSLQDAEAFLAICPQEMGREADETQRWQQIDIYLTIILNFSFYSDPHVLTSVYRKYFTGQLHHFLHRLTAGTFLRLANHFLACEDALCREELLACGLTALRVCKREKCLEREDALMMGLQLLIGNRPQQAIFDAIGKQLFCQLIDHYDQANGRDQL